jgi:hypothetical protein
MTRPTVPEAGPQPVEGRRACAYTFRGTTNRCGVRTSAQPRPEQP